MMPANESGFSLIEVLAAIVVLLLIIGAAFYYVSFSSTRGKAIYQTMNSAVEASQEFLQDTGCYPNNMASLGTPGSMGRAQGLDGCVPNDNQWDGPYLTQTTNFPSGNLSIPETESGKSGTSLSITYGGINADNAVMQGRGEFGVSIFVGPLEPQVAKEICKLCNGCSENDKPMPSTCVLLNGGDGTSYLAKVFASVN